MAIDFSKFDTKYRIAPIYKDQAAELKWANYPSDAIYGDEKRTGYATEVEAAAACDRLSQDLSMFGGDCWGFEVLED